MAKGIVAILDDITQQRIRDLWTEFEDIFGVHGVSITPYPHFSFHVADNYDGALLDELEALVPMVSPMTFKTAGLGIFTGAVPVMHLNVVRHGALSRLHKALHSIGNKYGQSNMDYYAPNNWLPHITLAQGDFSLAQIPQALELLQTRDFNWQGQVVGFGVLANHQSEPTISYMLR